MGLYALVGLVDARAFRGLVARFRCVPLLCGLDVLGSVGGF